MRLICGDFSFFVLYLVDPVCRDYLLVFDAGSKKVLYKNCTEIIEPLEILSDTNELKVRFVFYPPVFVKIEIHCVVIVFLQISVNTNSPLIYPKRGILIYYTGKNAICNSHRSVYLNFEQIFFLVLNRRHKPTRN